LNITAVGLVIFYLLFQTCALIRYTVIPNFWRCESVRTAGVGYATARQWSKTLSSQTASSKL